MNKVLKVGLGALIGGGLGLITSPIAVVANMAGDVVAPVSYPLNGAVIGGCLPVIAGEEDPVAIAAGALGGALGGAVHIPFAPLHFCTRWITTPVTQTVAGAIAGGIAGYNK
jgi:hypothetical protein